MAVSWIKTGAQSVSAAKQDEVEAQARKDGAGKMFRFWLKEKEEAKITFVDGDLQKTEGGTVLAPPRYYEHTVNLGGKWTNFVCPEKTSPEAGDKCPLCSAGDRSTLVALFTIIDHRSYTGKNDKVYVDQARLLVAKPITMEMLTKIALKRGGLAGCTFDVSRMGDNSASVGSMFDFLEKNPIETLQQEYVHEVEEKGVKKMVSYFVAPDYEQEVVYRTGEELQAMGLGKAVITTMNPGGGKGKEMFPGGAKSKSDYSKEL